MFLKKSMVSHKCICDGGFVVVFQKEFLVLYLTFIRSPIIKAPWAKTICNMRGNSHFTIHTYYYLLPTFQGTRFSSREFVAKNGPSF